MLFLQGFFISWVVYLYKEIDALHLENDGLKEELEDLRDDYDSTW